MNFRKITKEINKSMKGVTLIALVITIIVLLILAGVTINMVLGENGIIGQAQSAKESEKIARVKEEVELWKANNKTASYINTGKVSIEGFKQSLINKKTISNNDIVSGSNTIKIGDYELNLEECVDEAKEGKLANYAKVGDLVKYNPGTGTATSLQTENGDSDQNFSASSYKENWEVLYNDGTNVTIISSESIGNLTLSGNIGYDNIHAGENNNTTTIDKVCRAFTNSIYADIGRSVNYGDYEMYIISREGLQITLGSPIAPLSKEYAFHINMTDQTTAVWFWYYANESRRLEKKMIDMDGPDGPYAETSGVRPVIRLKQTLETTGKNVNGAWILK